MKRLKNPKKYFHGDDKSTDHPRTDDDLPSTSNADDDMSVDNQTKEPMNTEPWKKGILLIVLHLIFFILNRYILDITIGKETEEKSREEEFESYLEDLLL